MPLLACRGCLATEPRLFNLFKNNLYDEFGEVVGTPIFEGDDLPQHICGMCYAQLRKFSSFRDRCRKVQDMLDAMELQGLTITTSLIESIDRDSYNLLPRLTKVVPSLEDVCINENNKHEFIPDDSDDGRDVDQDSIPQSNVINETDCDDEIDLPSQPDVSQFLVFKDQPKNNDAQLIRQNNAVAQPIRQNNAVVQPIQQKNVVVVPLRRNNAVSKPIRRNNAVQPIQANNSVVQPIRQNNAVVKLLQPNKSVVQPIQPNNAVVQPVQANNAEAQPIQPNNAVVQPIQANNAEAQPILHNNAVVKLLQPNNSVVQPIQPNNAPIQLIRPDSNKVVKLWPVDSKVIQQIRPNLTKLVTLWPANNKVVQKVQPKNNAIVQPKQPKNNAVVQPKQPKNNAVVQPKQPKNKAVVQSKQPKYYAVGKNQLKRCKLLKAFFEDPKYCELVKREFNIQITTLTKEQQIKEIQDKIFQGSKSALTCCLGCGKIFINAKLHEAHINKFHDESIGPHVCDICNYRFPKIAFLSRHKRTHKFRVSCTKCSFKSNDLSIMIQHSQWHSGVKIKCKYCDNVFDTKELMHAHIKSEHVNQIPWCKCCGQPFLKEFILRNHIKRFHSFLLKFDNNCTQCGLKFSSAEALNTHLTVTCGDFACVMCGTRLESEEFLKQHIIKDHSRWEVIKMVRCSQCLLEFYGEGSLAKHEETCGSGYPCQECGISLPDTESLQYHKETHLKTYRTCKECNLTFDSDNYRRHCEKYHHSKPEREYRCRRKTTARVWSVSGSIITSNVETPVASRPDEECKYICEVCGKGCPTKVSFKSHTYTHRARNLFKCEPCNKSYRKKEYFQRHMMIHKGIKLYGCSLCEKRFHSASGRTRHIMRHAGIRRHVCNFCKKAYVTSTEVKTHIKTVHMSQPTVPRKRRARKNKDIVVKTEDNTNIDLSNYVIDNEVEYEYVIEEVVTED
ncbi:zinc finger protein 184-like isoform X2 [Ostrinia furnacalis]|uniref:zinc finger protein 184-like isoform X2 n=1 Tax=Ostrinia furnacalis TaxID=93504 RepID=UPI00103979DF|nr:zinc finger protein 184-like isoform X2 [Ostrinia furnacalis]